MLWIHEAYKNRNVGSGYSEQKKGTFEEKKKPLVYFSFDPDVILVCRQ